MLLQCLAIIPESRASSTKHRTPLGVGNGRTLCCLHNKQGCALSPSVENPLTDLLHCYMAKNLAIKSGLHIVRSSFSLQKRIVGSKVN